MSLTDDINALDDNTAERLLATLAENRLLPPDGAAAAPTPDLIEAMDREVGPAPVAAAPSRGELARATLLLLAEDPDRRAEIDTLIRRPPPDVYAADPVTLIVVGTATLAVLQSYIKVKYDQEKGLRVKIEKQPMNKTLLGKVIGLMKGLFVRS